MRCTKPSAELCSISAPVFVDVQSDTRTPQDYTVPTTSTGYFTFRNIANIGVHTVWVRGTSPALTIGTVTRTSDTTATVTFTSDQAGNHFHQIDGAAPANAAALVTAGTNETAMTATTNTINLTGLAVGQRTLYIAGQNGAAQVSNMLTVNIPATTPITTAQITVTPLRQAAHQTKPQQPPHQATLPQAR